MRPRVNELVACTAGNRQTSNQNRILVMAQYGFIPVKVTANDTLPKSAFDVFLKELEDMESRPPKVMMVLTVKETFHGASAHS